MIARHLARSISRLGDMDTTTDMYTSSAAAVSSARRKRRRSRRRITNNSCAAEEDNEKKKKRNRTESERVSKINQVYDELVELLGGVVVKNAKKGRIWRCEGREGKLRKLDILEEITKYILSLMHELEGLRTNGRVMTIPLCMLSAAA